VRVFATDDLTVRVHDDGDELARDAASIAAEAIAAAVTARGAANVMFASGNSQLGFLDRLVDDDAVPWDRVTGFHMDEYVGVDAEHPASFARYMRERICDRASVQGFHVIRGDAPDAEGEADRYATLLGAHPLDLCCLGIGENGHLAFNDPPPGGADFADERTVKVVTLDERCRAQQVGEGHFATVTAVPPHAITVTIPGLLAARRVLAIVPERRKAEAVRATLIGPITEACPASILRRCGHATLLLDRASASLSG
jgi:glucosamine-6-phosphate deaminase